MKTPITYYGGKQKMTEMLLSLMPAHKIYCEPFFGGGALFWAKPPSYLEAINDNNDNVVNFLEVARKKFDALKRMVDFTLLCETQFWNAFRIYCHPKGKSQIERAWAFWVVTNFAFSAKIGGGIKFDNGTSGSHSGVFLENKKKDFSHAIMTRLSRVQISCRDALKVIEQRDTPETILYLDPPYVGADMGHYKGYTDEDFANLLDLIGTIKGKFILSSYPNENLQTHVARKGWMQYEVDMRLTAGQKQLGHRRKTEVITTNFRNSGLFN